MMEKNQEDPQSWFNKLVNIAGRAGVKVMEKALIAYYVAFDPKTPKAAKLTLIGALAYLVMPVDLIPDFIPIAGFTDDFGALLLALDQVQSNVEQRHIEKAKQTLAELGLLKDEDDDDGDGAVGARIKR